MKCAIRSVEDTGWKPVPLVTALTRLLRGHPLPGAGEG